MNFNQLTGSSEQTTSAKHNNGSRTGKEVRVSVSAENHRNDLSKCSIRSIARQSISLINQNERSLFKKLKLVCGLCKSGQKGGQDVEEGRKVGPATNCSSLDRRKLAKELEANLGLANGAEDFDKDVDGGYAWIVLTVMFLINASTFGTARAYGLIFEKMARQDEAGRTLAALPFTIMGAVENMGGPLTGYLLSRASWRWIVFLGSCLITLSHLLAAIFDTVLQRIITMGLMCGLGLSLVSISAFQINNAYFKKYRSTAFGLGLTGAAFGTFYISPLCQYVLDNYDVNICYLVLSLILFPNVLLSLLLKPKKSKENDKINANFSDQPSPEGSIEKIESISGKMQRKQKPKRVPLSASLKIVLRTPLFHLIWPTQLIFCWLNFVYGMIIVDFGKDRGLSNEQGSQLILYWALGQLIGRLVLGSLVDLKLVSYKLFTIISFAFVSLATWCLNNLRNEQYTHIVIPAMVLVLAMFISAIYILFNNLMVEYMDKSVQALSVGISSFTGSFFLLPRASVIGHYRDTIGNYDSMLTMFALVSLAAAMIWLLIPYLIQLIRTICSETAANQQQRLQSTTAKVDQSPRRLNVVDLQAWERYMKLSD